jgi:Transglutaminase-like superfamily
MWERLRRFSALEGRAQSLFLRASLLLPLLSASLRRRGFAATQSTLKRLLSPAKKALDAQEQIARTALAARMVRAAVKYGFGKPSCLEGSLALWWLLRRQGIPAELRIGVRKENRQFEAHAWVEYNGSALNEPEEHHQHYHAFDATFPVSPPEDL